MTNSSHGRTVPYFSHVQAAAAAISLIDFGKKDFRNSLISTEISRFMPFAPYRGNVIQDRTTASRTVHTNSVQPKEFEEKETSRQIFIDLKKIIFTRTKMSGLWIPALRETTTATGAPPDEYERPDDLKEICINRIEASSLKAAAAADPGPTFQDPSPHRTDPAEGEKEEGQAEPISFEGKLRMSVFGQIVEGISQWDDRPLRRSFIHMQDAGQARAFFVKFTGTACSLFFSLSPHPISVRYTPYTSPRDTTHRTTPHRLTAGEGVDDHGGPYRAALHTAVGEEPNGFLELLTPCMNSKSDSGEIRYNLLHSYLIFLSIISSNNCDCYHF
jgi:hypothetical protein